MPCLMHPARRERGFSLVEMLMALVILSVGILALARLFPAATRRQEQGKLAEAATYYAQERMEYLSTLSWSDTALTAGRHPGGSATENLGGTSAWKRYYTVTSMAAPLTDLKTVTVTVSWKALGNRTTSTTTYLRR